MLRCKWRGKTGKKEKNATVKGKAAGSGHGDARGFTEALGLTGQKCGDGGGVGGAEFGAPAGHDGLCDFEELISAEELGPGWGCIGHPCERGHAAGDGLTGGPHSAGVHDGAGHDAGADGHFDVIAENAAQELLAGSLV